MKEYAAPPSEILDGDGGKSYAIIPDTKISAIALTTNDVAKRQVACKAE